LKVILNPSWSVNFAGLFNTSTPKTSTYDMPSPLLFSLSRRGFFVLFLLYAFSPHPVTQSFVCVVHFPFCLR
jgi:hypothetical protein